MKNKPDDDGLDSGFFAEAWSKPHSYAVIKTAIYNMLISRDDFSPENPYDDIVSMVTTTGMIRSAYELRKNVEVRYDWELLDDQNVIMHSCFGTVEAIDIKINAQDSGFLMDIGEDDFAAFSYKNIFWVCAADTSQFK